MCNNVMQYVNNQVQELCLVSLQSDKVQSTLMKLFAQEWNPVSWNATATFQLTMTATTMRM